MSCHGRLANLVWRGFVCLFCVGAVVEHLEYLDLALKALASFGLSEALKVAAGVVTLILVAMKAYTYGRDKVLKKVRALFVSEESLWDRPTRRSLAKHAKQLREGPPVLTIENFKGGVGKSTVSANLAAYYDWIGLKVLLIDFDYQGSLTDSIIKTDDNLKLGAIDILERKHPVSHVLSRREKPIADFQNTDVLAAAYTLNRVENRVAFKWLVGESRVDVRYNVHDALSSREMRKEGYDIVIVDAPPRLTTASANAICASTHVLVPTILDNMSATAAVNTLDAILKLKDRVSPTLKIVGVVPTFVFKSTGYKTREVEALAYLKSEIANQFSKRQDTPIEVFENERITRKEAFANAAGEKVALFEDVDVRAMFTKLGESVARAIGGGFAMKVQNGRPRPPAEARQLRSNLVNVGR
jgi:cellulose biosynthesis protein BcsQ